MCCHVTGDGGVDRVLDGLEIADKRLPVRDRRFTLIHAYFPAKNTHRASRQDQIGKRVLAEAIVFSPFTNPAMMMMRM